MVLYGLNENLRSYKSLKKVANFRLSPALRARARGTGPQLAFHTIGVKGYYNSVQPPLSEIPGSAPGARFQMRELKQKAELYDRLFITK